MNTDKSVAQRLADECGIEHWDLVTVVGADYIDNLTIVKWALAQKFGVDKETVEQAMMRLFGIRLAPDRQMTLNLSDKANQD